jgi:hypothetical protein
MSTRLLFFALANVGGSFVHLVPFCAAVTLEHVCTADLNGSDRTQCDGSSAIELHIEFEMVESGLCDDVLAIPVTFIMEMAMLSQLFIHYEGRITWRMPIPLQTHNFSDHRPLFDCLINSQVCCLLEFFRSRE